MKFILKIPKILCWSNSTGAFKNIVFIFWFLYLKEVSIRVLVFTRVVSVCKVDKYGLKEWEKKQS